MKTIEEIIQAAIPTGLGLPRDPIALDVLRAAIDSYNKCGQPMFDSWPWDSKKIDQFPTSDSTYVTSFTDGVITFVSTVDMVLAVMAVSTGDENDIFIWPESEINAAMARQQVSSQQFVHLSDTSAGLKRIKVNADDGVSTYRILATKRFVEATYESTYSASDPSATPTDYRVLTWPIQHCNQAIVACVADDLRVWDGQKRRNDWQGMLQTAVQKVQTQEARSIQIVPACPMFDDMDDWTQGEEGFFHVE